MNVPPPDFWVKAAAGIVVGLVALALERADAAMTAKHAKKQGIDDLTAWYDRKVIYVVAAVWVAVIFSTVTDLVKWRSDVARDSVTAQNEARNQEDLARIVDGQRQLSDLRSNFDASQRSFMNSRPGLSRNPMGPAQYGETPTLTPINQTDRSDLFLPSSPRVVRVVRDESDYALVADRLSKTKGSSPPEGVTEPKAPRRTTPVVAFRPKSASLTINVDPRGRLTKVWYSDSTKAVQGALTRAHAQTGRGSIIVSESGKLELSLEGPKQCEATVEYRNGKLVWVRFDERSVLVHPEKGYVRSWLARGIELRLGFCSRTGDEAWFETFTYSPADSKKENASFVASLYPEEKRIELRVNCKLAVNSAYSDVGIDELEGGTLTIASPLAFWQKRPLTLDAKNPLAMSSDANAPLMAIDRADRGLKIQQDDLGWHQVLLPLRKEDLKPMRP